MARKIKIKSLIPKLAAPPKQRVREPVNVPPPVKVRQPFGKAPPRHTASATAAFVPKPEQSPPRRDMAALGFAVQVFEPPSKRAARVRVLLTILLAVMLLFYSVRL